MPHDFREKIWNTKEICQGHKCLKMKIFQTDLINVFAYISICKLELFKDNYIKQFSLLNRCDLIFSNFSILFKPQKSADFGEFRISDEAINFRIHLQCYNATIHQPGVYSVFTLNTGLPKRTRLQRRLKLTIPRSCDIFFICETILLVISRLCQSQMTKITFK